MVYSPAILTIPCERIVDAKDHLGAGTRVAFPTPDFGCENRSSVHHALTPAEKVRRQAQLDRAAAARPSRSR
jgi:hypothetical protein